RSEVCECSERRQEFAVTLDRACDSATLHGTPYPGIHPGDHRGVEVALQEIDVAYAAPAAAGNVDAVGTLLALKIGFAREIVLGWDRQAANFGVSFNAERVVAHDRDLLGGKIFRDPLVDEGPERRRHSERTQLHFAHRL